MSGTQRPKNPWVATKSKNSFYLYRRKRVAKAGLDLTDVNLLERAANLEG